jgi:hypothetical protein
MPEVSDGTQHSTRQGLAQAAKTGVFDLLRQVFKEFEVSLATFASADPLENL